MTSPRDRNAPISLADEAQVRETVGRAILGIWEVANELTRLRPSRRERFRVTIFGSARIAPGSPGYAITRDVARSLAEMGCDVVTGGGPGLMQAANEGAAAASDGSRSVGISIELPFEQSVNEFVGQAFEHKTFFTRLHHFVLTSDAFLVAPGGIGTVLETFMIWQLLQVRHLENVPLVLVGAMWPGLLEWARGSMLGDPALADREDMSIPRCAPTADEAVAIIREHHQRWHAEGLD